MNNPNDTIAAISTPMGEGGIGIIRISGKKAVSIADKIFNSKKGQKPSAFNTHTIHYGHVVRRPAYGARDAKREIIDEALLTVMKAPKTYTKEDIVEINCHGGALALKDVLDEVVKQGARLAEPGEFTKRAFLNGRIDLAQAEAVMDIITSKTDASLRVALGHLEGDYSKEIERTRKGLLTVLEQIEAKVDFEEEADLDSIPEKNIMRKMEKYFETIKSILDTKDAGMLLKEGVMCVVCGKPNAGKSSLLNALLRRNRAIVTHVPGTTRDAIEESISIKGIPARIVDTAGIMKSKNFVEKISIEKSKAYIKKADIILFVLDLSKPLNKKDIDILKLVKLNATIVIANKSDLKRKLDLNRVKKLVKEEIIAVSLKMKKNINLIEEKIAEKILGGKTVYPEARLITSVRHKNELEESLKSLKKALFSLKKESPPEAIAIDIRSAIFRLGLIVGKSADINVLDGIFKKFCIGK